MLLLGELGNRLKEAREEKNMSLDDLQTITKIQKRYLLGIEEGNYGIMPGKFYVRAFIKQYAEAVGLDPEQIFEEFKSEIPSTYDDEESVELSRVKTHKELPKSASKAIEMLPRILVFGVVIAVAIVIWVISQQNGGSKNDMAEKENSSSQVEDVSKENDYSKANDVTGEDAASEETAEKDKPAEEEKAPEQPAQSIAVQNTQKRTTTYELSGTDKFELEISSKERTWISIKNGKGKTFYSANLEGGQSQKQDFSAEEEIKIVIGYMPNTEIKVNGEVLKYELDPTKVTTQNINIIHKKE
ncbi:helix-turn-helix domain-containing protein [Metabacillus fastidiosus]|nr:RodZ family helix-turn-helix domain-containing protein [Metabacillus fastidiosus]MED4463093.1 helix-turn-helix domain-containing protein [Metabacillus fastidiosus]